ncbi:hypothetical protein GCM10020220_103540 [Nonomuraea rubra]
MTPTLSVAPFHDSDTDVAALPVEVSVGAVGAVQSPEHPVVVALTAADRAETLPALSTASTVYW